MNLVSQVQNFNIVETVFCDLIQNGSFYEMQSYSSPAKRVSDVTGSHRLLVSVTDNARLAAHWEGFISTHKAPVCNCPIDTSFGPLMHTPGCNLRMHYLDTRRVS